MNARVVNVEVMMPAVVRLGDQDTGHGCYPPRANNGSCSTVFADGKLIHRKGDSWNVHSCPDNPPHDATLSGGSGTVMVEGAAVGRVGDSVSCGGAAAQGSSTVFAG